MALGRRVGGIYDAQDTRGRYGSEGVWHMMTDDVPDGHDMAAWIVRQPWSDGGFGTLGTSYVGGTQHALAVSNPPGLKTSVPVDAVANAGRLMEARGRARRRIFPTAHAGFGWTSAGEIKAAPSSPSKSRSG